MRKTAIIIFILLSATLVTGLVLLYLTDKNAMQAEIKLEEEENVVKTQKEPEETTFETTVPGRWVNLNNYGMWGIGSTSESAATLDARLTIWGKRDFVTFGEFAEWPNDVAGWRKLTPASLKAINGGMKVYRYESLMTKSPTDSDWNNPADTARMSFPITRQKINDPNNVRGGAFSQSATDDWWLRDGNNNVVVEDPHDANSLRFVDVGKTEVQDYYVQQLFERNKGKGFDGFVFDILVPDISASHFAEGWFTTHPMPSRYPTGDAWFTNAWQPFLNKLFPPARASGYRVIGNCAGDYNGGVPKQDWQRSVVDGTIYEQSFLDWDGSWLPPERVEQRLNSITSDPLETWVSEAGLWNGMGDYEQKRLVSLAGYYMAVQQNQARYSYHYPNHNQVFYDTLWDFNIGSPMNGKGQVVQYGWKRSYSNGVVLLNYGTGSFAYNLGGSYTDYTGKSYSGTISVAPKTGLILRKSSGTMVGGTSPTPTVTKSPTTIKKTGTTTKKGTGTGSNTTTSITEGSGIAGKAASAAKKAIQTMVNRQSDFRIIATAVFLVLLSAITITACILFKRKKKRKQLEQSQPPQEKGGQVSDNEVVGPNRSKFEIAKTH